MQKQIILILFSLIIFYSCKSTQSSSISEKAVNVLIEEKQFEITSDWAFPLNTNALNQVANSLLARQGGYGNRFNLIGNANYIRFDQDTISGYLPFFGEQRIGGGSYGRNGQIEFEDVPTDLQITKLPKKNKYELSFRINDKNRPSENYQIRMNIFFNKRTNISISSSHRTVISYTGNIERVEDE